MHAEVERKKKDENCINIYSNEKQTETKNKPSSCSHLKAAYP